MEEDKRLLYGLRNVVLNSVFWGRKLTIYYDYTLNRYGPMLKDHVFLTLFNQDQTVGLEAMEARNGGPFKIEELSVCPLSVPYLVLGNVVITGSEEEKATLQAFNRLVSDKINRYEGRSIRERIKHLQSLIE